MRSLRNLLTTRGRALVGAGAVLGVAGIVLGFRDLTRFGVLLIALPLLCILLVKTRKATIRLDRTITPARVSAGQSATVALRMHNVDNSPTPLMLAEERLDYLLGDRPRFSINRIPSSGSRVVTYPVRSHMRGRHQLGPLGVLITDPFGLANRSAILEGSADLVVLPAVSPLSSARRGAAGVGSESEQSHMMAMHGEDDVTIREYRDGDDLRRIHWPATARTGDLMVRQEDQPAQRRAVLLIDPRPEVHAGHGTTSSFEWAVRAAASVAVHLDQSGYAVHLLTTETVQTGQGLHAATSEEMLDVLALTELSSATGEDDILRTAQTLASGGGLVIAITGAHDLEVTERVASLRTAGLTGIAFVLDAGSFAVAGDQRPSDDVVEAHVDALHQSGWRAVAIHRDTTVADAWSRATAGSEAGTR